MIALSAYEDRQNVLEMLRAGAVGYLVKGAAAEELVEGIQRVASGGTSLSSAVMSGVVSELATQLEKTPEALAAALAAAGLTPPESPKGKPTFAEHGGELYWLNVSTKALVPL